jgi:serine/threonine-protein kinase
MVHEHGELPPAARPGTVLGGKYRVDGVLGVGGMGIVLAATHVDLGKSVAVKMLLARATGTVVDRFRREARVAAQLSSPHIAQVLDFGTHDDRPFLVMEFLEGNDLEAELERRRTLPVTEVIDVVLEACIGLAHAHACGLVHRDLKPANVFLAVSRAGRRTVKLLDFGLIKGPAVEGSKALTASREVFGTPQYMAPEQIKSAKNVDARCDQHALALIVFELISGRPAYLAESVPQLIVMIATEQPPSLCAVAPHVSEALAAIVARALAKRPDERFPHIGELAAALAPFGSARAAELAAEVAATLRPSAGAPSVHAAALSPTALAVPGSSAEGAPKLGTLSAGSMGQLAAAQRRRQSSPLLLAVAAVATVSTLIGIGIWLGLRASVPTAGDVIAEPAAPVHVDVDQASAAPSAAPTIEPAPSAVSAPTAASGPPGITASVSSPRLPAPKRPPAAKPSATGAASKEKPTCTGLDCY